MNIVKNSIANIVGKQFNDIMIREVITINEVY
jgi:hypothetical protein